MEDNEKCLKTHKKHYIGELYLSHLCLYFVQANLLFSISAQIWKWCLLLSCIYQTFFAFSLQSASIGKLPKGCFIVSWRQIYLTRSSHLVEANIVLRKVYSTCLETFSTNIFIAGFYPLYQAYFSNKCPHSLIHSNPYLGENIHI